MTKTCLLSATLCIASFAAETPQPKLQCEGKRFFVDGLASHCEMREFAAAFAGGIDLESAPPGAISIRGWDEPGVRIRAQVTAAAPDSWQASQLAGEIQVKEATGVVRATGPAESNLRQWSVSYEIFVPRSADLTAKASVGAITIEDVTGKIRCSTNVGAIQLSSVNGDVSCRTGVGALSIALSGGRWEGPGLNVETGVGAIDLRLPDGYSAHLDLSTGLGSVTSTLPMPVRKIGLGRRVSADLNGGGATLHGATGVGAITVK